MWHLLVLYAAKQPQGAAKRYNIPIRKRAADDACDLVVRCSTKPVSLNRDGAYLKIASILYEVATGIREADLERQCRAYLESMLGSIANYRSMKKPLNPRDIPMYLQEIFKARAKDQSNRD